MQEITEKFFLEKSKHWHVIGKKGCIIEEIRHTGVHILVPGKDSQEEDITLTGTQDEVARAKEIIRNVTPYTEYVDVPFWAKNVILKWLNINYGQLSIKLEDDLKEGNYTLMIHGSIRNGVQECREEIISLINGLKTTEFDIQPTFYEYLLNNRRMCNSVSRAAGVHIELQDATKDYPKPYIFICGQPENVDKAEDEMKQRADEFRREQVAFESRYHSDLIGTRGENINKIRHKFPLVFIAIPDRDQKRDAVFVSGPKADVDGVCEHLKQLRVQFLQNKPLYERRLQVPQRDQYIIIGQNGETIRKLRRTYKVDITVPKRDTNDQTVVITGFSGYDVDNAAEEILEEIRTVIENKRQQIYTTQTTQPASNNNQNAKGRKYFSSRCMAI